MRRWTTAAARIVLGALGPLGPHGPVGVVGVVGVLAIASVGLPGIEAAAQTRAQISLVSQAFSSAVGGGTFRVVVAIDALNTVAEPSNTEVVATIHQQVKSRQSLRTATNGKGLGAVVGFVRAPSISVSEAGSESLLRTLEIKVGKQTPECTQCVELDADAVYPVTVELRRSGGESVIDSFTTFFSQPTNANGSPPSNASLKVALVVPIVASPTVDATKGEARTGTGVGATASMIALSEALASVRSVPLTVAATPQTLDQHGDLLDTLRSSLAERDVVTLPYVGVQPTTLALPGMKEQRQELFELGRTVIRERLGVDPVDGIFISPQMISDEVLDDVSIQRLVLGPNAVESTAAEPPLATLLTVDPGARSGRTTAARTAAIADAQLASELTAKLSDRQSGSDDILRAQHVLADLTLTNRLSTSATETPGATHGIAVLVPETTAPATLVGVLAGLTSTELKPVTLSELFKLPTERDADGRPVLRRPAEISDATTTSATHPIRASELKRYDQARSARLGYESMFAESADSESATALAALTRENVTLLSDRLSDSNRSTALNSFDQRLERLFGRVSNQTAKRLTLTARAQPVQVAIVNDTGQPIRLTMIVETDTALLPGAPVDSRTPGRQQITRELLITERVHREEVSVATKGPGRYSMLVSLKTPNGYLLSQDRYTLQATSIGTVGKGLTIVSLLILALWWARTTIRTRRRRSRERHPTTPKPRSPVSMNDIDHSR